MKMASHEDQEAYVLSYRRNNIEEHKRLDWQHEMIKHAIWDDRLIHDSIPSTLVNMGIADLGCGTGIWLDDVANTLFACENDNTKNKVTPLLVGFDINSRAFNPSPAPGVRLVQHDCTEPFDDEYIGKFGLVNIRGLAYAVPEEKFPRVVENAVQLLSRITFLRRRGKHGYFFPLLILCFAEPNGYLQWTESEARLFKAYPETEDMSKAMKIIDHERQERGLVA